MATVVPLVPGHSPAPAPDLLSEWLELAEPIMSPAIFKLWAGIAMIAGALERRVWVPVGHYQTYPNLYTLLVAPPGVGKQVILEVQELWREARDPSGQRAFRVAPMRLSQASLVDTLAEAKVAKVAPMGPTEDYASLLIASEELQVLLPKWDPEFLGKLTALYQNPPVHEERLRYGKVQHLTIVRPQLNILGGTQPGMMQETFPDGAWNTGLMARFIMVFSIDEFEDNPFELQRAPIAQRERLLARLAAVGTLAGEMRIELDAQQLVWGFWTGADNTRPQHSKLEHYNRRRGQMLVKLALVSAIARGRVPPETIQMDDVRRARKWMLDAEALMPDIFRAMMGKSDREVLEELYFFVTQLYKMNRATGVPGFAVMRFLTDRVPGDKVEKLLSVAESAGFVERLAGTNNYKPRGRDGIGVE